MPKLAIYVPKKEMRKIERWRKRLNFSQIFMRALHKEIQEQSRVVKADNDQIAKAAAYYKQMMAESSQSLLDFMHTLGGDQVLSCQHTPADIRRLVDLRDEDSLSQGDERFAMEMYEVDRARIDEFLRENGYNAQAVAATRPEICRAYLQGVATAWEQVCERM